MKTTHPSVLFLLAFALLFACKETDKNSPEPLLSLTTDPTSVNVGIKAPTLIQAVVTKDATGDTCEFTVTDGSFNSSDATVKTITVIVDVEGKAEAFYFPPTIPGDVYVTATIKTINRKAKISITGVPSFPLNLPDTISAEDHLTIDIQVDPAWAQSTMEVTAPLANLKVLGPAANDIDDGTKVYPIIDANGKAQLLFTAPENPQNVIITASLFGTTVSNVIEVK